MTDAQPLQDPGPEHDPGSGDDGSLGAVIARLAGQLDMFRMLDGEQADDAERASRRDRARDLGRLTKELGASARAAGRKAVLGGAWLVDLLVDIAPRVPMRDAATLRAQHPGLSDDDLAQLLIAGAAKATMTVGAAGGALAAIELAAPPTLLSIPAQLAAETLLVAAIEVKLIAELHEVYGLPATGPLRDRAQAYLVAWSNRRGIDPLSPAGLRMSLGLPAKAALRKRLVRRAGRNVATLGPLMSGALAGSVVNHRETRRVGDLVRDDLRRHRSGRTVAGETVRD